MATLAGSSSSGLTRPPTMLEQLLEEINFQRTKELRQMLKDDSGFVILQGTTYWTDLFVRHFLFQAEHTIDGDDLLFFVRKKHVKTSSRYLPKFETEVDVFRKDSKKLPIGDPDIDWEETVYLNLVVHQFDYTLTLAICTRTSPKELQVLRRHSQKVYASPSRRRMDAKGDLEEMTYPHICFMVDNFDEVFCDILVRDGEMVCVELVASDREGAIQGVIFLGSIRYDALKKVYDARSSLSTKMAQRMTFGLFSGAASQRIEFVRMKGPRGKGHAEMAVTKPKGSGAETPTSEPGYCATDSLWDADWDDAEELFMYRHQRRLSDPSANLNNFVRGGWRTKPDTAATKARSENEGLDSMANGLNEIEAGDVRDADLQDSSWGGRGSPGNHRSPQVRRRRSPFLSGRQQRPKQKQRNSWERTENENSSNHKEAYHETHGLRNHQHNHIEVGSEILVPAAACLTDDNVRQKLDAGAILVHGKEELPYEEDNNRKRRPYSTGQINHERINNLENDEEHRRLSDDEVVRVRRTDGRRRLRSAGSDHEEYYTGRNKNKNDEQMRDKNANARITRGNLTTHRQSATLPRRRRRRALSGSFAGNPLPPHRVTPDGTAIYYWCELPRRPGSQELDDGAYNPLWTMRGFTQTFHFWKETRRAQSVPLNAFLTYITLPWWSIAKDILDHREGPILTF
ncbi:uncharacterized protein LOC126918316 isoform X1 [Bombus affinis]|uniref:Uncharacterized protein LOC100647836 isoform X1 n=3 Tax=Bombus TaxID=28641 RepID=A0A9B0BLC0_BOMTE|nr:uncharacterized protein LOC100647836 isoform X1 [Bombus terrestris]XP_003490673.1 uncharacterized protein LOC100743471 isoform X1 [Bombus impatiens]XP_033187798.1 uncharacterized protein LOC117155671 isoform X1 [Bombus vancouverensis nearcticus]XP_033302265.1 uncharacterized protein LOC117206759 isoform X1 [Bombus bifarius]XP_050480136.1 uncharacterized protein LOC126868574 isoform X1 [Bombus huntii]XP_050582013.1 uncharacterized protein LOC126918316 isoform X1 [Bombus affinis]